MQEFLKRRKKLKEGPSSLGKAGYSSLHEEDLLVPFHLEMVVINALLDLWRREHKRGYQEVKTPMILERALWEQSGH